MSFQVGHYQDFSKATGCTVFLFEEPNRAVAAVRGGAPGGREISTLFPGNLVEGVDAVFFSGGSALGLSCGEGVVDFLRERKKGFKTPGGIVPIVAGAVIYDLEVGEPYSPDREWGYKAALSIEEVIKEGTIGAGTGATVGKLMGMGKAVKGGLGRGKAKAGGEEISAFVVTNSLGNIYHPQTGELVAGVKIERKGAAISPFNTTLTLVVFDCFLSREELFSLMGVVHSALASCIRPFATLYDGDTIFLVSTGKKRVNDYLALVSGIYESVGEAVLNSVTKATGLAGILAKNDIIV
ncbi:MAG TPA: P1 family peptidase [Candidatus Atribacteria bacterium]|nr:P1 family peptidase [Candidatus Atribacteria bacterium]